MPFSYGSPLTEHLAVRQTGGIFDVSHMGQIRVAGPDSLRFLNRLLPTPIKNLPLGGAQYSVLCRADGGLIDDLVVYALSPLGENYLLCVNASFKDKDLQWIKQNLQGEKALARDESDQWALVAVQGPKCFELCERVFPTVDFRKIPRFGFKEGEALAGKALSQKSSLPDFKSKGAKKILFSRTGYTGEQGFEIYIPQALSQAVWDQLLKEGAAFIGSKAKELDSNAQNKRQSPHPADAQTDAIIVNKDYHAVAHPAGAQADTAENKAEAGIGPVGLGARDTLRLEMGYLLAGQDFDESKSPLQAGLAWLLKSDEDYIGRKAIEKQKAEGQGPFLKGFVVEEPSAVPRRGAKLYNAGGDEIGVVTSGAKSPSLGQMIGLAYWTEQAKAAWLDLRGEKSKVRRAKTPFLKK